MTFSDIKEFTYIGNTVIIDGQDFKIATALDSTIDAVQFHKGKSVLEEPLMKAVEESKYQYAIDEWVEAKRISEIEPIVDTTIKVVTMRQARLALLQGGLLATVDNAILNSSDEALKIEWEYATEVNRDWASFITMANELGMTDVELDDLFLLASTL